MVSPANNINDQQQYDIFSTLLPVGAFDETETGYSALWDTLPESQTYSNLDRFRFNSDGEEGPFLDEEDRNTDFISSYYDLNENQFPELFFETSPIATEIIHPPEQSVDVISTPSSFTPELIAPLLPSSLRTSASSSPSLSTASSSSSDETVTPPATRKTNTKNQKFTLKGLIGRIRCFHQLFSELVTNDLKYQNDFTRFYLELNVNRNTISFPVETNIDFTIYNINKSKNRDKENNKNKIRPTLFRWYSNSPIFNVTSKLIVENEKNFHIRTMNIPGKIITHPYVNTQYNDKNSYRICRIFESYFRDLTTRILKADLSKRNINPDHLLIDSSKIPDKTTLLKEIFNIAVNNTIDSLIPKLDQLQADPKIDFDSLFDEDSGSPSNDIVPIQPRINDSQNSAIIHVPPSPTPVENPTYSDSNECEFDSATETKTFSDEENPSSNSFPTDYNEWESPTDSDLGRFTFDSDNDEGQFSNLFLTHDDENENQIPKSSSESSSMTTEVLNRSKRFRDEISSVPSTAPKLIAPVLPPSLRRSVSSSPSLSTASSSSYKPVPSAPKRKTNPKEQTFTLEDLISRVGCFYEIFSDLVENDLKYKDEFYGLYLYIDKYLNRISFPVKAEVDFFIVNNPQKTNLSDVIKNQTQLFSWYKSSPIFNVTNELMIYNGKKFHRRSINIPEKMISHPYVNTQYKNQNYSRIYVIFQSYFHELETRISEASKQNINPDHPLIHSGKIPDNGALLYAIFNHSVNQVINSLIPKLDLLQANPEIAFDSLFPRNSGSPHE